VLDPKHPIAGIGDRVSAGQALAVLEQLPTDQATLEAAFNQAQKALEHARQDYDRLTSLDKIVSQKDLQHAVVELKVAQADFDRLSNQMSLYHQASEGGRTVNRLSVRAPISGVVVETHVSVGEQVEVNDKLFRIVDLNPLYVEADVYETDLPAMTRAGRAIITPKAYSGETFAGDLVNVGGIVDETTRTTKVIFSVSNPDGRLKAGMFAEVSIDVGTPTEVLTVPKAAVVEAGGRRLVYVHTQPEAFEAREVSIAQTDGEDVAIQSGVVEGERVVVMGGYQLWSQGLRQ
jgi:cobalt-zinc-cadmium efflux system membrane fusion protein